MKPSGSTCLPNGSRIGLPSSIHLLGEIGRDRAEDVASPDRTASVTRHQTIMITPMMVVAPMIFSAWSLDSWMPLGVDPPEVDRDQPRRSRREPVLDGHQTGCRAQARAAR